MISAETIKKAKEGDQYAIEQLCIATWEPVYRFVYFRVQNREEAEDITQEAYVKTLTYLQEHRTAPENLRGFIQTVALNELRDRWRQKKRRGIPVDFAALNPAETAYLDHQKDVAERLRLKQALARLSEEQQVILDLRIVQGYSVAETAKLVGKTEAAVRTSQYRALQALATVLDDDKLGK